MISHSLRVTWKDLIELFRNRLGLIMLVLMPIFMMSMVGFIYPSDTSLGDVSVALVNEEEGYGNYTSASAMFITALEQLNNSTGMMTLTDASSLDEVRDLIQREEVEGGIIIASNFSLAQQNVEGLSPAVNASSSLALVKPYNVETAGVISGDFSYFDFVAPGIMAMTVMMSVMTGLPAAISHEKEVGTLDGMMAAPINRLAIILGKTLAQMARGMLQGILILTLAVALFGVTIHGSILLVFALLILGVFSFVGLGVVITSFAKDQETAMMLMTTLIFPMLFLSGVFFPIQQMPWYMQSISKVLPLTYIASALRKVMVLGADVPAITTELAVLIVFGVIMTTIAVPVFKRAMTR